MYGLNPRPKKRPTFLMVICILTFVGAGLGTLGGLANLATAGMTRSSIDLIQKMKKNADEGKTPVPFDDSLFQSLMIPDSLMGDSLSPDEQAVKDSIQSIFNTPNEQVRKSTEVMEHLLGDVDGLLEKTVKYAYHLAFAALIGNLLCLFGGIMMFKMKKMGFFVYITGHVVEKAIPLALLGGIASNGLMGSMMMFFSVIMWFFALAFIVMYALNLKHMD